MSIEILVAGDCGPAYSEKAPFQGTQIIEKLLPTLQRADLRFVNCMRTYSDRAAISDDAPQVSQPPQMAALYSEAGFDGVTMANNHAYDSGPDALVDTVELFRSRNIQVTGAGHNLAEAMRPVIVARDGVRVGYLGCTGVGKAGAAATATKPGIFNVGITTQYEHRGAHAPVRIVTAPEPDDLQRLVAQVKAARAQVDTLVVAFHSGVIRLPRVIADYQVIVAHAVIDAGADAVVCHAPHIPKGVEVYRGRPVFYSLGVFAMTKSFPAPSWQEKAWMHGAVRNHTDLDPARPWMPYGEDSRFGLMARLVVSPTGALRASMVPIWFDADSRPEVLTATDPRFGEFQRYMEWASVDLPHRFDVAGDEIVVSSET